MSAPAAVRQMEKAVHVSDPAHLHHLEAGCDRAYFGNEFCQRLNVSPAEINEVLDFIEEKKFPFTFVTNYVTDDGLKGLEPLIAAVARRLPGSEIVVNDWGALRLVNEKYRDLVPILGRLLHKMKKGPRIAQVWDRLPGPARDHFQSSNITLEHVRRFLHGQRVARVAFDNVLQGFNVDLNFETFPFRGSLYYPYVYIATTRSCLLAGYKGKLERDRVGIFPCRRECRDHTFELLNDNMPVPLILKGNTQFFVNDKLREENDLLAGGIDRIVYQPELPM